jgi:hypothetical protein
MRKRNLALLFFAVAIATFATLSAQATPLTVPTKANSLVKEAGCRGPGTFCPAGLHWVCDFNRCGCAPCVFGGPRPYWSKVRTPPNGSSSSSTAPRATVHYIVLDEVGHCAVVDSKPSAGSTLKMVGDQDGYTSLESADKALKDFRAECKDVVVAGAEDKFKAAQAKAQKNGVEKLTQEDIEGLSIEQIKKLRGY